MSMSRRRHFWHSKSCPARKKRGRDLFPDCPPIQARRASDGIRDLKVSLLVLPPFFTHSTHRLRVRRAGKRLKSRLAFQGSVTPCARQTAAILAL